jgi:S-(hydroxymethyl)glutathione dehydrogenase/alcohol dehydrogenase
VKPQNIPDDIAVLFGCALPTGAGIVLNEINPKPGTTAVVFGLGGIGLIALMTLKAAGCESIFAVDVSKEKLDLALELGATQVINASSSNPVTEIQTLTKGQGVDYAIDAAGRAKTIEQAFASIRKFGGLCIFASHPPAGENINLDPHELISGKQIRGSWGGAVNPERDIPRFAELYAKGALSLHSLIKANYTINDVNIALGLLKNGLEFRPLIRFN